MGSSSLTPDAVFNSLCQLSNPILGESSDSKKFKIGHPHKFKIRPLRPVVKRKSINFLDNHPFVLKYENCLDLKD